MPPRGRPTLVVLSLVTSSSVASFSSASSCDAAACRSLVLAASFAFRRNSVLVVPVCREVEEFFYGPPHPHGTLLEPRSLIFAQSHLWHPAARGRTSSRKTFRSSSQAPSLCRATRCADHQWQQRLSPACPTLFASSSGRRLRKCGQRGRNQARWRHRWA